MRTSTQIICDNLEDLPIRGEHISNAETTEYRLAIKAAILCIERLEQLVTAQREALATIANGYHGRTFEEIIRLARAALTDAAGEEKQS